MVHSHTVHLALGALLSACTMCGTGSTSPTSTVCYCLLLSVTVWYRLDLPYFTSGVGEQASWQQEEGELTGLADADVRLFSGCADEQESADAEDAKGKPAGAMTTAFLKVLASASCVGRMQSPHLPSPFLIRQVLTSASPPADYASAMGAISAELKAGGYSQVCGLLCSI